MNNCLSIIFFPTYKKWLKYFYFHVIWQIEDPNVSVSIKFVKYPLILSSFTIIALLLDVTRIPEYLVELSVIVKFYNHCNLLMSAILCRCSFGCQSLLTSTFIIEKLLQTCRCSDKKKKCRCLDTEYDLVWEVHSFSFFFLSFSVSKLVLLFPFIYCKFGIWECEFVDSFSF